MIGGGGAFLFRSALLLDPFAVLVDEARGDFLLVASMVQLQEAPENLPAGSGRDGMADAVVFGEEFEVVKAVVEGDVAPVCLSTENTPRLLLENAPTPPVPLALWMGLRGHRFGASPEQIDRTPP